MRPTKKAGEPHFPCTPSGVRVVRAVTFRFSLSALRCGKWAHVDSNHEPLRYQHSALPLSYAPETSVYFAAKPGICQQRKFAVCPRMAIRAVPHARSHPSTPGATGLRTKKKDKVFLARTILSTTKKEISEPLYI
jgi:hypothetical protein